MTALVVVGAAWALPAQSAAALSTADDPSPSPSSSSGGHACPYTSQVDEIVGWGRAYPLMVVSSEPDRPTAYRLTRTAPAPVAVVRQGAGHQNMLYLRLGESTSLVLDEQPGSSTTDCEPQQVVLRVRPAVSIGAKRNGPRDYTFFGRVGPAHGQTVTIYREREGAGPLRVATGTVRPDGTYRIARSFSGTGTLRLFTGVSATSRHIAGRSSTRSTVIH